MSAVSFLIVALLAQPLPQSVEVHGGVSTFWYTALGNRWEPVRGDVQLDARRPSAGAALAHLSVSVLRGAELWTVELSQPRPDELFVDADLDGPVGPVHAAVALRGRARVTRNGEVISATASLQAFALTTGFHEDDGTFRTLPRPRSADLELLVRLQDVPGEGSIDIGFDSPKIFLDGAPFAPERAMAATAPDLPSGVAPPRNGGGTQAVAETQAAPSVVVSQWSGGGARVVAGTLAAPGAAPSGVAPAWNGGGAQAVAGAPAAPSGVAPAWNGGVAQAGAGNIAPAQAAPAAAPSVVFSPWNGARAQAVGGPQAADAVAPRPGTGGGPAAPANASAEPTALGVASPWNGTALRAVPVTAAPANPTGEPRALVVASPWNGGPAARSVVPTGSLTPSPAPGLPLVPASSLTPVPDVPRGESGPGSAR